MASLVSLARIICHITCFAILALATMARNHDLPSRTLPRRCARNHAQSDTCVTRRSVHSVPIGPSNRQRATESVAATIICRIAPYRVPFSLFHYFPGKRHGTKSVSETLPHSPTHQMRHHATAKVAFSDPANLCFENVFDLRLKLTSP